MYWRISWHKNCSILQASTMAMFHFGFVLEKIIIFKLCLHLKSIWLEKSYRKQEESSCFNMSFIWSHKKICYSYENKKNFPKIPSHKKAAKPYAFLLVFLWLHMTWVQRYCLRYWVCIGWIIRAYQIDFLSF